MKIWFLLSRLAQGGLERVQINLAEAFRAEGIDAYLVVGSISSEARQNILNDIPIIEISPHGKTFFPSGLLATLHRERPDIVFTTSDDVACLVLMIRSVTLRHIRIICTQHLSISGPDRAARGIKRVKLAGLRWLMRRMLPRANRIVAVSRAVADDMRRELELDGSSIDVIHNPIVTPEFPQLMCEGITWPWPDHKLPTIVFVGRLSTEKRPDILLEAFVKLRTKLPARLLIVGDGPRRNWLTDEIRIRGLGDSCRLVGFQINPLPWTRESDLLVLPSDYEGFGNVLVEAMACGTQVVSTNCPDGPAEILDDGKYGTLVPCGNVKELASAMQRALLGTDRVSPDLLLRRANEFGLEQAVRSYLRVAELNR